MRQSFSRSRTCGLIMLGVLGAAARADAQTPYANTSAGRPLGMEDAVAMERYALDAHLSPVGMGRQNGRSTWFVEPGLAYGLVPRTQVEVTVPIGFRDAAGGSGAGIAGLDVSALYALNVESRSLPALAIRGGVLMPVGNFGVRNAHESVTGIATRTFGWGRAHFNAGHTFGDEPPTTGSRGVGGRGDPARWTTGLSVDRALPLRGLLVAAEVFARRGLADSASARWNVGAGARYQWTRQTTLDVGAATSVTGAREWSLRAGVGRTMAVRSLMPGLGPWGKR